MMFYLVHKKGDKLYLATKLNQKALNSKINNVKGEGATLYKCTRCGHVWESPKGHFFMSKTSPLFTGNELYTGICCSCTNDLFQEMRITCKDDKLALIVICHYLDVCFSEELFESIKYNANFSFGNYLKLLNGTQYKGKNFTTYLINTVNALANITNPFAIRDKKEANWRSSDLKNKNYVVQTVGYDCFEDESYTDENRKFLFNTMADYLTDDIVEDPHKLQCVISLVKTTLQVENINKLINNEFTKPQPNEALLKSLSDIKDKFTRNINSIANDNGISEKGSGNKNKGSNTLSNIMKEMADNGFEEIKVNIFNTKMSDAFRKIADISNKSLFDQLNLQSDQYAQMVATQREIIQTDEEKILKLEEDIRLLKVENKELKELKEQLEGEHK